MGENKEKPLAEAETLKNILEKVIFPDVSMGTGQEIVFSFIIYESEGILLHYLTLVSSLLLLQSSIQTYDIMTSSVIGVQDLEIIVDPTPSQFRSCSELYWLVYCSEIDEILHEQMSCFEGKTTKSVIERLNYSVEACKEV